MHDGDLAAAPTFESLADELLGMRAARPVALGGRLPAERQHQTTDTRMARTHLLNPPRSATLVGAAGAGPCPPAVRPVHRMTVRDREAAAHWTSVHLGRRYSL
jgi:hypothetical protein